MKLAREIVDVSQRMERAGALEASRDWKRLRGRADPGYIVSGGLYCTSYLIEKTYVLLNLMRIQFCIAGDEAGYCADFGLRWTSGAQREEPCQVMTARQKRHVSSAQPCRLSAAAAVRVAILPENP